MSTTGVSRARAHESSYCGGLDPVRKELEFTLQTMGLQHLRLCTAMWKLAQKNNGVFRVWPWALTLALPLPLLGEKLYKNLMKKKFYAKF